MGKAYWSYILYFIPKINYQLPLLSLTIEQCDSLMSIVLQALLSKLHVNRNTARSIVYSPEDYGGMALPHLYVLQGMMKVSLFLGRIHLQDKTVKLLCIGVSTLQLVSGLGCFVLNLPFFPKWVMARMLMVAVPLGILILCQNTILININFLAPYKAAMK